MKRHSFDLTVSPEAIDVLGHVNNIEYVRWVQEAAIRHSESVGWGWDAYVKLGAAFVIRKHTIEYKRPAHRGDVLRITTWIAAHTRITATRATEIVHATSGNVLLTAETLWAFVDLRTARPTRVPEGLLVAFADELPKPA